MVTQQLTILDLATQPAKADQPRCRMCIRPARWLATRGEHAAYCSGHHCGNRERICQKCSQPFTVNTDGAGTKYCSTDCKIAGYRPHSVGTRLTSCAWCTRETEHSNRRVTKGWPFICADCLAPLHHVLPRLRAHHVPHEMVRALLDKPECEICGRDVLTPVRDSRTSRHSAPLVVDHDHRCCPSGAHSCGNCVRGLLCHHCNAAAGMLRDDPELARLLADYLVRTK